MAGSYRILAIAHLHHAFANHFQPLAESPRVHLVTAIRPTDWTRSRLHGIDVHCPSVGPLPWRLITMFFMALGRLLAQRYDAIVAFTPLPYGLCAWLLSLITGRPYHLGIIGEDVARHLEGAAGLLGRRVLGGATTVSVPGPRVSNTLMRYGVAKERLFQLPHGLSPEFAPAPDAEPRYAAIFVGDLLPVKQPRLVIEIWRKVAERKPSALLCIVGDGPLRKDVEHLVARYGLEDNVLLAGFRADVWRYMQCARLFLLASQSEGLPFAMIESMACGVVPVVNDVGDIGKLVVPGRNGILLDSTVDVERYAAVVCDLLDDRDRMERLSKEARVSVERLTYAAVTEAWETILERLLGRAADAS